MASSFTYPTVQHTWQNADSTPSSGSVVFTLSKAITNGGITIAPTHVIATINASGGISQALVSNTDPGTVPQDSYWMITERVMGAMDRSFSVQLPSASAGALTVDLGSLMPGVQPPEFA